MNQFILSDKRLDGLKHFLDKVKQWHLNSTSNEDIWPKKNSNSVHGSKNVILAIFRKGRDGRALIMRPSRIPHRNSKIPFALRADEFLAMLEGTIREAPFFKVRSGKLTVCKEKIIRGIFC